MEQAMRSRARVSVALRQYHDCSIFMSLLSVQCSLCLDLLVFQLLQTWLTHRSEIEPLTVTLVACDHMTWARQSGNESHAALVSNYYSAALVQFMRSVLQDDSSSSTDNLDNLRSFYSYFETFSIYNANNPVMTVTTHVFQIIILFFRVRLLCIAFGLSRRIYHVWSFKSLRSLPRWTPPCHLLHGPAVSPFRNCRAMPRGDSWTVWDSSARMSQFGWGAYGWVWLKAWKSLCEVLVGKCMP